MIFNYILHIFIIHFEFFFHQINVKRLMMIVHKNKYAQIPPKIHIGTEKSTIFNMKPVEQWH